MNDCVISIIVPVYNTQKYLRQCLDSLLAQTGCQMEIIAVNDGSTDRSLRILQQYQKKAPDRLKVFSTENRGVSHARNYGASKSSGQYLWFVDSDDYVEIPDACEILAAKISLDHNDLILFGHIEEDPGNIQKAHMPGLQKDSFRFDDCPQELDRILAYPWNKLIRRDLFDAMHFPENMRFEDLPVSYYLAAKASSVGIVRSCLYHYRRKVGFLSVLSEAQLDLCRAFDLLTENIISAGKYPRYHSALEHLLILHTFVRFQTILLTTGPGLMRLRLSLLDGHMDYLETHFPAWEKNPFMNRLPAWLYKKRKLLCSRFLMHVWIRLSSGPLRYAAPLLRRL